MDEANLITINLAPPSFEIKKRTQTALISENTVLQCEAKGEKPIGVLWNMNNKRLDANVDSRYLTILHDYVIINKTKQSYEVVSDLYILSVATFVGTQYVKKRMTQVFYRQ